MEKKRKVLGEGESDTEGKKMSTLRDDLTYPKTMSCSGGSRCLMIRKFGHEPCSCVIFWATVSSPKIRGHSTEVLQFWDFLLGEETFP